LRKTRWRWLIHEWTGQQAPGPAALFPLGLLHTYTVMSALWSLRYATVRQQPARLCWTEHIYYYGCWNRRSGSADIIMAARARDRRHCFANYRQACAKRSHAGLRLLSGPKWFFSPLTAKLLIAAKKVRGSSITVPSMVGIRGSRAGCRRNSVMFFVCLSRFGMTKFMITETLWSNVISKTIIASFHRGWFVVVHLHTLVAWHSGRTSVFDWRTFHVLRPTCSWRVTT